MPTLTSQATPLVPEIPVAALIDALKAWAVDVPDTADGVTYGLPGLCRIAARHLATLSADLTAAQQERDKMMAMFDAADIFMRYSTDGGATWQEYTLEERVRLAIAVCCDDDAEQRLAAAEARAEKAERDHEAARQELAKFGPINGDRSDTSLENWFPFSAAQLAAAEQARATALEEAAQICEKYSGQRWSAYKTWNGPERASDFVQGQSDGAEECANAIRALSAQAEGDG